MPRPSPTAPSKVSFDQRPMLVFWEVTRACQLACKHCRANAMAGALPGELTHEEGLDLIDQVAGFGRPYPILVLTGGDCLLRPDIWELVAAARARGIPTALSPSVTPQLTPETVTRMVEAGVNAVSISLDGARAQTHDGVRGIPGHFAETLPALRALSEAGLTVQVNTTVMSANLDELADVARLVKDAGAHIWEVFFLVHVGRGVAEGAITPEQHEEVCHLLYDASQYGFVVRTVEAPFFRRVVAWREEGRPAPQTPIYRRLAARLTELLGEPAARVRAQTARTRDGKGLVFVAYDGEVTPAGFLPLPLGSVTEQPLAQLYRDTPLLQDIRAARFTGRCGVCEYADLCGGSRARAYAASGDPLGEDPACSYQPAGRVPASVGG
ncbi:TIGR04053 family radical SAM/SPASM domain-containing protein [Phycicoccus endophyticus]|uniref:TIGR04053 family radical SAM/SPASM domain-containing protein n=1 Tax=Phycicoccus endophyticus TaxID=1690220 RepID=A0A7G9R0N6_9MICO|nr:TIGR04053 family radical SAM/SPASM domain-containing protein [Phycicoccus endophyticus]NHI19442.1 TIGR04053 family radical SAM/SPASM domain-containing protein [Phycicoccus endophyticus]QNN49161.1 TIGR04053 family radical SAM/SPASM domain-containing protein [Phycicoccus endophyticus]GGL39216.1 radical SAM protein [Phycicoccus endophyticus]